MPAAFFLLFNFSVSTVKILFLSRAVYFSFLILLFLLLRHLSLGKFFRPIIGGISSILFIHGIVQKFILFPFYLKNINPEGSFYSDAFFLRIKSGRIFSLFALPTLYAIVCVVLIVFCLHFLLESNRKKVQISWGVLLTGGLFNLILTESFGGVVLLAGGIVVYFLLAGILKLKFLVPSVMVLSLFLFITIGLRFGEAQKLEPITLRFSNWVQATRIIAAYPFGGIGLGNYENVISSFTRSEEAKSIYAHNFFLQFTAETGIMISAILLLFPVIAWRKLKPYQDQDPRAKKEKIVYYTVLLVLLLYNVIDIGFYFFTAGVVGAIVLSQVYPYSDSNPLSNRAKFPAAGIAVTLLLFVFVSFLMIVETLSDSSRKKADFLLSQKDFQVAETNYKASLKFNPFNYKSMIGCAYLYVLTGRDAQAEPLLDQALRQCPDSGFAHFLKSRMEFKHNRFFTCYYHALEAYNANKMNNRYRGWSEFIKKNLENDLRGRGGAR